MGIGRLFRRILGQSATTPGLLSVEALRGQIQRERLRSDRSGAAFSLAAFRVPPPDVEHGKVALVHLLERRLRAIDDVGRLADGRIAALLPETDSDGAWTLVDEIAATYARNFKPLECEVYSYPPADQSDGSRRPRRIGQCGFDEDGFEGGGGPHRGELEPALDVACATSAEKVHPDGRRAAAERSDRRRRARAGDVQRPARSLETIFAQGLPWWKRAIDVTGASLLLLATLPLMLAAALAIKLTSRGPVFFAQARAGLAGRPFIMYKLRTMSVDAESRKAQLRKFSEQDGPAFKMTHDPRVTPVGRFLRAASIDELPQLWNVLRGEMSLVGPRPLPVDESAGCLRWQQRRLDVTPGLTCIWQISGRSLVSFADWVRMDLQYAARRTLAHDLKLLFLTVPALVLRRGK